MHFSKSICFVSGLLSQTGCTVPLVKTCPSTVNQIKLNTTVINGKTAAVINANWVTKQLVSFLCPTTETKTIPIIIFPWQDAQKLIAILSFSLCHSRLCMQSWCNLMQFWCNFDTILMQFEVILMQFLSNLMQI